MHNLTLIWRDIPISKFKHHPPYGTSQILRYEKKRKRKRDLDKLFFFWLKDLDKL